MQNLNNVGRGYKGSSLRSFLDYNSPSCTPPVLDKDYTKIYRVLLPQLKVFDALRGDKKYKTRKVITDDERRNIENALQSFPIVSRLSQLRDDRLTDIGFVEYEILENGLTLFYFAKTPQLRGQPIVERKNEIGTKLKELFRSEAEVAISPLGDGGAAEGWEINLIPERFRKIKLALITRISR